MAGWKRQTLKLQKNHGWRAKPGHKIFVADRGAVRFDYPASWVVVPESDSIKFYDKPPPKDDALLQVSMLRLAAGIEWERFPLPEILRVMLTGDDRGTVRCRDDVYIRRPDLEMVWNEASFTDPNEKREARSRSLVARGSNIQPFITLDFWPEDTERLEPVWQEIIRTLRLGEYIRDPTRAF